MSTRATRKARQLLFSRNQVREMLGGISTPTIHKLERAGQLTPIRLVPSPQSTVFYAREQLEALLGRPVDDTVPSTHAA